MYHTWASRHGDDDSRGGAQTCAMERRELRRGVAAECAPNVQFGTPPTAMNVEYWRVLENSDNV